MEFKDNCQLGRFGSDDEVWGGLRWMCRGRGRGKKYMFIQTDSSQPQMDWTNFVGVPCKKPFGVNTHTK